MQPIRYIHAADLHLDRPFSGISISNDQLLARLRESSYLALKRLGTLCETEKPDFLLLAGDIYDQEEHSVKAQLAFLDLCKKLATLNIPVFMVHGNHDPFSSRIQSLNWPDNVRIFKETYAAYPVFRHGEQIALIHGISHAQAPEDRNLAAFFKKDSEFEGFQLGLLHCSLGGAEQTGNYAPCSLEDLLASNLDAWALGHSHKQRVFSEFPFIAYSGSSQGFHINETGPRGCMAVTARKDGYRWKCSGEFRPLASIQWRKLGVDLTDASKLDEIEERILNELEKIQNDVAPGVNDVLVRIELEGRTPMHADLRPARAQDDLRGRLSELETRHPAIHIKDLILSTKPDLAAPLADQQDLPGEIWRIAAQLENDPQELGRFAEQCFAPLFSNALVSKYLKPYTPEWQKEILRQAKVVCQEYLENK